MTTFRCPVCGYLHTGSIDFYFCPVCNAPADSYLLDRGTDNYAGWDINTRQMIRTMAETGSYNPDCKFHPGSNRRGRCHCPQLWQKLDPCP